MPGRLIAAGMLFILAIGLPTNPPPGRSQCFAGQPTLGNESNTDGSTDEAANSDSIAEETGIVSRASYIIQQPDSQSLLHGLTFRLQDELNAVDRMNPRWTGAPAGGGSARIGLSSDRSLTGEVIVGFFRDPRWWQDRPVQIRTLAKAGIHTVSQLPPGEYYIGAMSGQLPAPHGVAVHIGWPNPVVIAPGKTTSIRLPLLTTLAGSSGNHRFAAEADTSGRQPGATIQVLDSHGQPSPYCSVVLSERKRDHPDRIHLYHEFPTDAAGKGTRPDFDGMYSVSVRQTDFLPDRLTSRVVYLKTSKLYDTAKHESVTIHMPEVPTGTATVSGIVRDQHREPLNEFTVTLRTELKLAGTPGDSIHLNISVPSIDDQGRFSVRSLPPGDYIAYARAFDYSTTVLDFNALGFTVPDRTNAVVSVVVPVESRDRYFGRAVYAGGEPVYPGTWTAQFTYDPTSPWGGRSYSMRFRKDGSFQVTLSDEERKLLLQNFGGQIRISGAEDDSARTTIHINELSKDSNNPTVLTFPGPD